MDVTTAVAIIGSVAAGGATLGANVVEKLLGPTADYLGNGIRNWTERRVENIGKVFQIASERLGDKINEDGAVPPRVLKGILEEGSFTDDHISRLYLGGVLASSRSGESRDDRGVEYINLFSALSSYQKRTHYIFYHIVKKLFDGVPLILGTEWGVFEQEIYLTQAVYNKAMAFSENENPDVIVRQTLPALYRQFMIGTEFQVGGPTEFHRMQTWETSYNATARLNLGDVTSPGLIFQPTIGGVEVFLWAYGKGALPYESFFESENKFELDSTVVIGEGYFSTVPLPETS
jgi:hypothetical protein